MAARFNAMLLDGAAGPDLGTHGMTSEEERAACGTSLVITTCATTPIKFPKLQIPRFAAIPTMISHGCALSAVAGRAGCDRPFQR